MKILALETSTDACSVALQVGEETHSDHRIASQQHAGLLLPMIDALMKQAGLKPQELDAIAFGQGPGSFTGVRIATSVAQGIALGARCPLVGVSSLQAIAQGCLREFGDERIGVALDARMQEVYWGLYQRDENDLMRVVGDELVCPAPSIPEDAVFTIVAGAGADRYRDVLLSRDSGDTLVFREDRWPMAIDLLALAEPRVLAGETTPPADAMPVYLRNKVALTEAERAAPTSN